MLSLAFHTVFHMLYQTSSHTKREIPCEMAVIFTQYSYVFHMIISRACDILQCEKHVKRM